MSSTVTRPIKLAVLVDHQRHALAVLLEVLDLRQRRRARRHEVGLVEQRFQRRLVELAGAQRAEHPAQLQHARELAERVAEHRQAHV